MFVTMLRRWWLLQVELFKLNVYLTINYHFVSCRWFMMNKKYFSYRSFELIPRPRATIKRSKNSFQLVKYFIFIERITQFWKHWGTKRKKKAQYKQNVVHLPVKLVSHLWNKLVRSNIHSFVRSIFRINLILNIYLHRKYHSVWSKWKKSGHLVVPRGTFNLQRANARRFIIFRGWKENGIAY